MKKFLLIMLILSVIFLIGCGKDKKGNHEIENNADKQEVAIENNVNEQEIIKEENINELEITTQNEDEEQEVMIKDNDKEQPTITPNEGYSDEQLIEMVKTYRKEKGEYIPEIIEIDGEEDNIVTIHLYEVIDDHTATTDWYYIDRLTGTGKNILEEPINLIVEK